MHTPYNVMSVVPAKLQNLRPSPSFTKLSMGGHEKVKYISSNGKHNVVFLSKRGGTRHTRLFLIYLHKERLRGLVCGTFLGCAQVIMVVLLDDKRFKKRHTVLTSAQSRSAETETEKDLQERGIRDDLRD